MTLGRTGFIGRFKPLHNGGAVALDELCKASDHVTIGIGSANRPLSASRPFTAEESREMISAYLAPRHRNYHIVTIDDFGHMPQYADGQRWRQELLDKFGSLDWFVTGNAYVRDLLNKDYRVTHPAFLMPRERHVNLRATDVRQAMAEGSNWSDKVPAEVAAYLRREGLAARVRDRFGAQILANPCADEDAANEKRRIWEG